MQTNTLNATLLMFAISFVTCGLLVVATHFFPSWVVRPSDLKAKQSAHKRPTSRLGGIGVLLGAVGIFTLALPDDINHSLKLIFVSVLPVFLAGLAEDLGWPVSPRLRLLAAAAASLLAAALLGEWITRSDIPGLDLLLTVPVVALIVTTIWCTGICHAFNLIDGVNGLSSGAAALSAFGLALIAYQAGETEIALVALMLVSAIGGFLVFNWPMGRVFLGDAGAYSIGHLLVWLCILLVARAPEVSALAMAGVFFWPVADTCLAIYRRRRAGRRADQPDRLHFHQLVMRAIEITLVGRDRRHVSNPLTTVVLLPVIGLGILGHATFWNMPAVAAALWGLQVTGFVVLYSLGMRLAGTNRKRWLPHNDHKLDVVAKSSHN